MDAMKNTDYPVTAVASGCELFLRFITLAKLDTKVNNMCFCGAELTMPDCKVIFIANAVHLYFFNRHLGSVKASCCIVVSFS